MKVFNREIDYAVRALIFLAFQEESGFISAASLAEELGLPLNFLRRICSKLIRAEILTAKEGACGGVKLDKKPSEIDILEIMSLFRNELELSDCTFRKKLCPNRNNCVLRKRILKIEDIIKREFQAITIQTLVDDLRAETKSVSKRRTKLKPRKEP